MTTLAFNLPAHLSAKADPALIARDEQQFAAIAETLQHQISELSARLAARRRDPGGAGEEALERDADIHRLTARLLVLRRFGLDLCLGRMLGVDVSDPVYIGRLGLADSEGRRLLVDWRAPAAEPFFAATHADPMGLSSRRRYRWSGGRVSDYWDEVFTAEGLAGHAALDDQSAFIADLGARRSARMRDVLGTLQADQDAIIRAGSRGALVVEGGPGTGKTVVALHRAAFLLHSDPHLRDRRGGVLFIGPHRPYLAYVADVLPDLGEEGVQMCTLGDLVPEGATAEKETDPAVARLKASATMVRAIEPAVRLYEEPPSEGLMVETPWADSWLSPAEWADAFDSAEPGASHNEARDQVWEELLDILIDKHDTDEVPPALLRRSLLQNRELRGAFSRAWPLLDAAELLGDLWSVPAYLGMCAPWLTAGEIQKLQREEPQAWTVADLPLLDAARHRVGDPDAARHRHRRESAAAAEEAQMARVIDDLIESDDSELRLMSMLRGEDLRGTLLDPSSLPADRDRLAGPFAHIIVDEAQELSDPEWHMLLRRCPSRSLTIVGDRAQARHGFTETWQERLGRLGLTTIGMARLSINYRTPEEVMTEAEPVIRAVLPEAGVPTSIRRSGVPVVHAPVSERDAILEAWLAEHTEGLACVIGDPGFAETPRVRSLSPEGAKGLEFDLVVLVEPEGNAPGIEEAVDRYVAMTRAVQQLVVLTRAE